MAKVFHVWTYLNAAATHLMDMYRKVGYLAVLNILAVNKNTLLIYDVWLPDFVTMNSDCTMECRCNGSNKYGCVRKSCLANEKCSGEDNQYECVEKGIGNTNICYINAL